MLVMNASSAIIKVVKDLDVARSLWSAYDWDAIVGATEDDDPSSIGWGQSYYDGVMDVSASEGP